MDIENKTWREIQAVQSNASASCIDSDGTVFLEEFIEFCWKDEESVLKPESHST